MEDQLVAGRCSVAGVDQVNVLNFVHAQLHKFLAQVIPEIDPLNSTTPTLTFLKMFIQLDFPVNTFDLTQVVVASNHESKATKKSSRDSCDNVIANEEYTTR